MYIRRMTHKYKIKSIDMSHLMKSHGQVKGVGIIATRKATLTKTLHMHLSILMHNVIYNRLTLKSADCMQLFINNRVPSCSTEDSYSNTRLFYL